MKPNILLILADQFRYDCLESVGKNPIKTPNLNRLTKEGTLFSNAYTPTPVCAPARQALLSGRQADSFGALWNHDFIPTKTLSPDDDYWTKQLQKVGYKNAFVGKWNSSSEGSPLLFGFEKYVDVGDYGKFVSERYGKVDYTGGWLGENNPVPTDLSKTHWLSDNTNAIIEEYAKSENPWHIRLDFTDPHLPCRPSAPFNQMYNPKTLPPWDSFGDTLENKPYIQKKQLENWDIEGMSWEDWSPCVARYYAMITQLDDAVGKVLNKLDSLNLTDNTIIIFSSDHGDTCGGHGMIDKHYILYDDVTRVPLIVRYPELFKAGEICDEFVSNCLDIAPTVEEICELPMAGKRHGLSLLKRMKKEGDNFSVSTSNGQQFGLFTQRCIRTMQYKFIWNLTDIDEFYVITDDPGEKINLIDDPKYKVIITELKKSLHHALYNLDDPFVKAGWVNKQLI